MLLSLSDLMLAFGVGRDAIRDWERDGKIPIAARTPGNHRRWHAAEIAPLLVARGFVVPKAWNVRKVAA